MHIYQQDSSEFYKNFYSILRIENSPLTKAIKIFEWSKSCTNAGGLNVSSHLCVKPGD